MHTCRTTYAEMERLERDRYSGKHWEINACKSLSHLLASCCAAKASQGSLEPPAPRGWALQKQHSGNHDQVRLGEHPVSPSNAWWQAVWRKTSDIRRNSPLSQFAPRAKCCKAPRSPSCGGRDPAVEVRTRSWAIDE